jgi:hypothetical protein
MFNDGIGGTEAGLLRRALSELIMLTLGREVPA